MTPICSNAGLILVILAVSVIGNNNTLIMTNVFNIWNHCYNNYS